MRNTLFYYCSFLMMTLIGMGYTPAASAVESCAENQWVVWLNQNDASSKQDILSVFDLVGNTFGIRTMNIQSSSVGRSIYISLNPDQFVNSQISADETASSLVVSLKKIPGTTVVCLVHP